MIILPMSTSVSGKELELSPYYPETKSKENHLSHSVYKDKKHHSENCNSNYPVGRASSR